MAVINGTLDTWPFRPDTGNWDGSYNGPPPDQIVVTGTGFGTKPYSSPITWELFEGSDGQLVSDYNPAWIGYQGRAGGLISTINPRFPGHKSAYNVATRDQFDTNYKTTLARKGRSRFISYYVRVNYRENVEEGQIKFTRSTTSDLSGGGGVYNGAGSQGLNAPSPDSWNSLWTGSNSNAGQIPGYLHSDWYPANRWIRIEYEIYLSDLDTPNGFYNVHCAHQGSMLSGNINQRYSGFGKDDYLIDTILLGIETVGTEKWLTPNTLTANTDYTISTTHSINLNSYSATWNSGGSIPTAAQVVTGITNALLTAEFPPQDINLNPDDPNEFSLYKHYDVFPSANFTRVKPMSVQQSETYEDDDLKQFYIGNADTWAACTESHPQPYSLWSDSEAHLIKYAGAITGRTWLYKKLIPNTTPIRVGEVVGTTIIYG